MKKPRIPQAEFAIADEPFALVTETSNDGDRIQARREQSERDRADADNQQLSLTQPSTLNQ